MLIVKFLGGTLIALIGLGVYLYVYLGFGQPVEVVTAARGPFVLVYKEHLGAYHEIGPTIRAVEDWATTQSLRCQKTFGEYLDDPAAIDQDRLRSRGGCVFDQVPAAGPLPPDFKIEERPTRTYAIGRFSGSPSIGPFKVYPKVQEYIHAQRLKADGPVIETYLIRGEDRVETEFLFPLESAP